MIYVIFYLVTDIVLALESVDLLYLSLLDKNLVEFLYTVLVVSVKFLS